MSDYVRLCVMYHLPCLTFPTMYHVRLYPTMRNVPSTVPDISDNVPCPTMCNVPSTVPNISDNVQCPTMSDYVPCPTMCNVPSTVPNISKNVPCPTMYHVRQCTMSDYVQCTVTGFRQCTMFIMNCKNCKHTHTHTHTHTHAHVPTQAKVFGAIRQENLENGHQNMILCPLRPCLHNCRPRTDTPNSFSSPIQYPKFRYSLSR